MDEVAGSQADVQVSGMLEYRDAEGKVIKTLPFATTLPLDAAQVANQPEK
jgi:hypothetical protein